MANSWMQTPAGYHIVGEGVQARAEITDFWAMVFNPSSMDRLIHSVIGAWLAAAFLVISVASYYLLKKRHLIFAKRSLKIGLSVACVALVLQAFSGHSSAQGVARNQPIKLAAFEGIYKTENGAPLHLFGLPDAEGQKVQYGLAIPKLLSWFAFTDPEAKVQGLDQVPPQDRPNVAIVFQTYHLMIYMWVCMVLVCLWALWALWRGTLYESSLLLKALVLSVLFPQIANQVGWVSAEMGRQPWIVQDLLRVSEGLSKFVTANQVLGSIILFCLVYQALFYFIYFLA